MRHVIPRYCPTSESGGLLWPRVLDHTLTGLIAAQVTLLACVTRTRHVTRHVTLDHTRTGLIAAQFDDAVTVR